MPVSIYSRYHGIELLDADGSVSLSLRLTGQPEAYPDSIQHTLVGSETLDQLAAHYYGREDLWWRIADANPGKFPDDWRAGDTLVIPPIPRGDPHAGQVSMANDLFYHVALDAGSVNYDLSQDISTLTIDESANQPASVSIILSDPFKVFSHAFQEGMELTVDLGDVKDHSIIFRGQIFKVEADFPKEGTPRLTLRGNDHSMKMGLRKRNRPWKDLTLLEIAKRIATENGFNRTEIKVLGDPHFIVNGIRQQDETDLAFLLRLAAIYGCETFIRADDQGDVFHFVDQQDIMKATPALQLSYGRCDVDNRLLSFTSNSDVSNIQLPRIYSGMDYLTGKPLDVATAQVKEVASTDDAHFDENLAEFRKKNPKKAEQLKTLITASKDIQKKIRQELGETRREVVEGHATADDLHQRAKNQYSTSILGMRASGTTPGIKNLHAQANVDIADVGGQFSGIWYLSSVKHSLNNQGYKCSFECKR